MSVEAVERIDELRGVEMAKKLDAAQEIAELNPEVANAASVYWGQVENICSDPVGFRRRLPGTATCVSGATKAAETTDNTLLIAGACAVGLGFYMYAG